MMNFSVSVFDNSPYFSTIIILAATIVIAKIINWLFEKVLRKAVGNTKTDVDDQIIDTIQQPIFWTITLAGIYFAIQPLSIPEASVTPLNNVLITAGLIIWGLAGVGISRVLFNKLEEKAGEEHQTNLEEFLPFLDNVVIISVGIIVILTALTVWGINITPALASAGVVGVAVAFAAKDTVANIFGGISIFLDKPYKSGDYIIIRDKYRGEVIQIGMRSTKIKTRDNVLLSVPNAVMATDAVINETGLNPELRIRIPLAVSYESNLDKVERLLIEVAIAQKNILKSPKPKVRYRKFGDFAIQLELLAVIPRPADRGRIIHELIKAINKKLKKEKIEVPFPQQVVHIKQANIKE